MMRFYAWLVRTGIVSALVLTLAAAAARAAPPLQVDIAARDYPNGDLLVGVDWLVEQLDDPQVRVIDMRSPRAYAAGHVPGAVNVPVDWIASRIGGVPMMYDDDRLQTTLNEIGLTPTMTAVIYDDLGMMNSARLFWTLEYIGHADVRVVNGGWNAWVAAGHDTDTTPPAVEATDYPIELNPRRLVTAGELLTLLDNPDVVILDARSPQEYTGEVKLADRGGHIPGALLFTWLDALTGGDAVYTIEPGWAERLRDEDVEVFKPADEIQAMLDALGVSPDKEVITYCQTLWRGAHVYFLMRLMGYEDVRGYDGSWAEWGNRPDLPIITGDMPGTLAEATASA